MKTIALVNSKGGTGKSTLAAALGVAAEETGERVFMVDLDPQGSLSAWGERRKAETPPVDRIAPDRLPAAIVGLARRRLHPRHHRHPRARHARDRRRHARRGPVPDTGPGLDPRP
jgi:cellulose biosynthesis protein BcsQ